MMTWIPVLPGHHQPWYWLYKINSHCLHWGRFSCTFATSNIEESHIINRSKDLIAAAPFATKSQIRQAETQLATERSQQQIRKNTVNKISSESGHNTSACQISSHSCYAFSRKGLETVCQISRHSAENAEKPQILPISLVFLAWLTLKFDRQYWNRKTLLCPTRLMFSVNSWNLSENCRKDNALRSLTYWQTDMGCI